MPIKAAPRQRGVFRIRIELANDAGGSKDSKKLFFIFEVPHAAHARPVLPASLFAKKHVIVEIGIRADLSAVI